MNYQHFIKSLIISLIMLNIIGKSVEELNSKECNLEVLRYLGYKSICENNYGEQTTCLGTPFPVKWARVTCANKYHNNENISSLLIECEDDGKWSNNVFKCRPECDDTNISFNLIKDNKEEYPPWYAEIVELASDKTVKNIYPGIIFLERHVLTKKEYLKDDFDKTKYIIRIPRLKYSKPKEYEISFQNNGPYHQKLHIPISNKTEEEITEMITILHIDQSQYIQFDDVTLPACEAIYPKKTENTLKLLNFTNRLLYPSWSEKLLPFYENVCFAPNVVKAGMEVVCFKKSGEQVNCIDNASSMLLRCQLGYQQKLSQTKDYVGKCRRIFTQWQYDFGDNNSCDLVCGKIEETYRPAQTFLIHKGSKTHNGFAPWHVAIYFKDTKKKTIAQICGGSIIHSNAILTAAHCFYNRGTSKVNDSMNYLIGAGKLYRQYETSEESEHYANVKSIHIPQNFEPLPIRNDIAVVILDHHMQYTANIKPVCVDFSTFRIPDRVNGHIVGWGETSANGHQSNELLTTNLTTITNSECRALTGLGGKNEITNLKFCATNEEKSSACQGDSGGGFVIKKVINNKERYHLIGIISSGLNSDSYCSDGFMTIFTNILFYKDFIMKHISENRGIPLNDFLHRIYS